MIHSIPSLRRSLTLLAVSGLVLFAVPAAPAAGAPDRAPSLDVDPAAALEAVDNLLVQPLPPWIGPGAHRLEVTYLLHGAELLAEEIHWVQDGRPADAVSLLAYFPEQRRALLRQHAAGKPLQVRSRLDGGEPSTVGFTELVRQTRRTAGQKTSLVAGSSRAFREPGLERLFAAVERDPECVQYCEDDYERCIDPCMDQGCIDDCKYYRDDCLAGCPAACTDPKSVEQQYSRRLVSYAILGSACAEEPWPYDGVVIHDYLWLQWEVTVTEVTTYCDGTQTSQVVNVYYTEEYCYEPTNTQCYYPKSVYPLCSF